MKKSIKPILFILCVLSINLLYTSCATDKILNRYAYISKDSAVQVVLVGRIKGPVIFAYLSRGKNGNETYGQKFGMYIRSSDTILIDDAFDAHLYSYKVNRKCLEIKAFDDGADLFNVPFLRKIKFVKCDKLMYPLFDE